MEEKLMEATQAIQITAKIQSLWPAWKTTEDELDLFRRRLKVYDYDVVCSAIEEHRCSKIGSMNAPKLWGIVGICKGKGGGDARKHVPTVNYWLECVENKEQPWRVGEQMKFWATGKGDLLHDLKQEAAAKESLKRCNQGGVWEYRLINFDIEYEGVGGREPAPF